MIKTLKDKDYPESTIISYNILQRAGILKITDFWRALCLVYGVKEFEILNLRDPHASEFESYIIDRYIDWIKGDPVEFEDIEEAVYKFGDFTGTEKLLFESDNMQNRLWAIFLYLVDPNINLKF